MLTLAWNSQMMALRARNCMLLLPTKGLDRNVYSVYLFSDNRKTHIVHPTVSYIITNQSPISCFSMCMKQKNGC